MAGRPPNPKRPEGGAIRHAPRSPASARSPGTATPAHGARPADGTSGRGGVRAALLLAAGILIAAVLLAGGAFGQPVGEAGQDAGTSREAAADIRVAFDPYSFRNDAEDPGTFVVRGISTVEYDLDALAGIVDRDALAPGRYEDEDAFAAVRRARLPRVSVVNDVATAFPSGLLYVTRDGRALLTRTVVSQVRPATDFQLFPFDTHEIPLVFTVIDRSATEVGLGLREDIFVDPLFAAFEADRTGDYDITVFPPVAVVEQLPGVGSFPTVVYRYGAKRHLVFYLIAAFVPPLLLLGLVSIAPWLNDLKVMDAARLNATAILAIFANMIVMDDNVPNGNYLTTFDVYGLAIVTLATLIVFCEFLLSHAFGDPPRWRQALRLGSLWINVLLWLALASAVVWHGSL